MDNVTVSQFRDILPNGDFELMRLTRVWNARGVVVNNESPQYARQPFQPNSMGIPVPSGGTYTSAYLQGTTNCHLTDGYVVGVPSDIVTFSASLISPALRSYQYLNSYGFGFNDYVVASTRTSVGEQYYINTFNSVDFYFVPTGFQISVSSPLVFSEGGTFILTKYATPSASTAPSAGMAINKWDGCFYYGTIHSPDLYNATNYGVVVHALYAKQLYNSIYDSGIVSTFGNTLADGLLSQTTGQATKVPIFFTAPQLMMNTNGFDFTCVFDGYRIQPFNTLISTPQPLVVTSI